MRMGYDVRRYRQEGCTGNSHLATIRSRWQVIGMCLHTDEGGRQEVGGQG